MFRKLVKAIIPAGVFSSVEPFGHLIEAVMWNVVMGFPARGMKIIGVTGTDGKTTTSTMIYTMLNDAGIKTGLMTTIGYGVPGNWHDNQMHMTTMPTRPMLERIKELKKQRISWLVLETTSHALAQHRVWGLPYHMAVFTNLTHEHLDYHGTFENYREAKLDLFRMVAARDRGSRLGVVNADDPSAPYFMAAVTSPVTYGVKSNTADLRAQDIIGTAAGSSYSVKIDGELTNITVHLPGSFNVYNSLAAIGVGRALGLKPAAIASGIAALTTVQGRMNRIEAGQDFAVIVDFAHTPESFEKILSSMKELTAGRLIVMFGSAGRRDVTKRGKQGSSAGTWADVVVITEEDDRDEDGVEIMNHIAAGVKKAGKIREKDLFLILDRTKAMALAIGQAGAGDTVLLLGKGHEKTIARADGEHPWDELGLARATVEARLKNGAQVARAAAESQLKDGAQAAPTKPSAKSAKRAR